MKTEVVLALDVKAYSEAEAKLQKLKHSLQWVKVGMELFYSEGPSVIEKLHKLGFKVFLDLKLHDIPNTVASAMSVLAKYQVEMTNCHIAGGKEMLEAAVDAYKSKAGHQSYLIGVTQLTSTNLQMLNRDIGIPGSVEDSVKHYAQMAKDCGLDGVVCSAADLKAMPQMFGSKFFALCPGIRLREDETNDQKRVLDPATASKLGAKFLVVGRPIVHAADPLMALEKYQKEILEA